MLREDAQTERLAGKAQQAFLLLRCLLNRLAKGKLYREANCVLVALCRRSDPRKGRIMDPAPTPERSLGDVLRDVLIAIANNQTDPAEREAMLEILRKDGWL